MFIMPTGIYEHKKGYKRPIEVCRKISDKLKGRIISPLSIEKMSKSHIGKIGYWKDKKRAIGVEWRKKLSESAKGRIISIETREKISKALIGNKNSYKYGLCKSKYILKNHRLLHRQIMEQHIGRNLFQNEVVHHIDQNKKNNDINNLMLFNSENEHRKYHKLMKQVSKKIN